MEYLRGWRALRQDPDWIKKVLIASVISLVPIVGGIVISGWVSLMLRRAVSGQDAPLPRLDFDMDYLGKLLNTGFKGFLARLLWSLPLMAVMMVTFCCFYIGVIMVGFSGEMTWMICLFGGFVITYPVLLIAASLPLHIAVMRAEITDDVQPAMRFKEVFDTTKLLMKELIVGQIVLSAIGMVAGVFGVITLYLGLLPAMVVMQVIQAYWLAEVYKAYVQKGGEPLPVGPVDVEGGNLQQPAPPQF